MRTTDARKLDHKTLTELRKRAVALVQEGNSPEDVAKGMGINRVTIYGWLSLYRKGGWDALDARKRGGRPSKLNGKAMQWIYDTITMKNPMQLKFPFALWTARMIGQVIIQRFKIKLSKASVCRLLGQLGLTPGNGKLNSPLDGKSFSPLNGAGKRFIIFAFTSDRNGSENDYHESISSNKTVEQNGVSNQGNLEETRAR
jgi:transposase